MACADCDTCTVDEPRTAAAAEGVCRHELHVTVHQRGSIGDFRDVCYSLGLRPLSMGIRNLNGSLHTEWMTGSSIEGTDAEARRALVEVGDDLMLRGYDPIRAKIEAAPWHPRARLSDGVVTYRNGVAQRDGSHPPGLPANSYWESHIGLWVAPVQVDKVHRTVYLANGYLSRNQFKGSRLRGGVSGVEQERWSATLRSQFLSRESQDTQTRYIAGVLAGLLGVDVDAGIRHEWTWLDACYDRSMPGGPPGRSDFLGS